MDMSDARCRGLRREWMRLVLQKGDMHSIGKWGCKSRMISVSNAIAEADAAFAVAADLAMVGREDMVRGHLEHRRGEVVEELALVVSVSLHELECGAGSGVQHLVGE